MSVFSVLAFSMLFAGDQRPTACLQCSKYEKSECRQRSLQPTRDRVFATQHLVISLYVFFILAAFLQSAERDRLREHRGLYSGGLLIPAHLGCLLEVFYLSLT